MNMDMKKQIAALIADEKKGVIEYKKLITKLGKQKGFISTYITSQVKYIIADEKLHITTLSNIMREIKDYENE